MKALLVLAIIIILLLLTVIFRLIHKNHKLSINIDEKEEDDEVLRALAFTDALTGVYNRTAYNKHVSEISKSDIAEGVGITLFDVDDFKVINDSKGHLAGDATLKLVAKALRTVFLGPRNYIYRIGGDEFAVISKNTSEDRLIESLICVRRILEKQSDIRVSGGYSMIKESINSSFRYADEMLYADKFSRKK